MKYKTADWIRSFVYALSCESGNDGLCAACRQRADYADEWEVCLFSRHDCRAEYFDFVCLAKTICSMVPSLTMYDGLYNSATYGEHWEDAIIIW